MPQITHRTLKKDKQRNKKKRNQQKTSGDLSPNIAIITLHINVLITIIKRERLAEWIKNKTLSGNMLATGYSLQI